MLKTMNSESSKTALDSLLGKASGFQLIDVDKIIEALMPFMIAMTVLSIIATVAFILYLVQKMRVYKAIMETRDAVREMNEREKAKSSPAPASPAENS